MHYNVVPNGIGSAGRGILPVCPAVKEAPMNYTKGRSADVLVRKIGCRLAVKTILGLCVMMLLCGCAAPLQPKAFASTTPAFDPITFWTGRTASWGVVENRDGAPAQIITTTTNAMAQDMGDLHMVQHVVTGGKESVRDWHIRRLGNNRFEASASDMVGTTSGSPSGRTLHWTWVLATKPGHDLFNVRMEQWMYLADNGTLLVRSIVTKFGVRLAEISEQFVRRE